MTDFEMYSLLVGFFLPPALAVIVQQRWSDKLKTAVAFVACLIAGAGVAYFQGDLTGKRFVTAALVVMTTGYATYRNFWKTSGVSGAIEEKTEVGGP